jgi:hypothetical protein
LHLSYLKISAVKIETEIHNDKIFKDFPKLACRNYLLKTFMISAFFMVRCGVQNACRGLLNLINYLSAKVFMDSQFYDGSAAEWNFLISQIDR